MKRTDLITASPKSRTFSAGDVGEVRFQDSADKSGEALESLKLRKPRSLSPRKLIELKNMDNKALLLKVMQAKKELADLILDKNMKKLKDLTAVSKKKKDVAQMLTVIKQKQLIGQLEKKREVKKT